jgi:type IV pilus assembly protein PilC
MPTYKYNAIDPRGERVAGEITASDPDTVVAQLSAQGLRIETVQLAPPDSQIGPSADPGKRRPLSTAETREVATHISEIVSAGVSLEGGLAAIAAEYPHGRMSRALRGIVSDLETGTDLETVLSRHQAVGYLPALVRAGQRSGRTVEILENFITGSQAVSDLRQVLLSALAYTLILLFQLIPLGLLISLKLVPGFGDLFESWGVTINPFTRALLVTSEFLRENIVWILAGFLCTGALLAFFYWGVLTPVTRRRLLCRIPVIGPVFRWSALGRFSPLLSALIEARVPLDEALVLAGDAAGDVEIAADCRGLASSLRAGNSLESAVKVAGKETGRFPAGFLRALTWENHQEGFPEVLRSMADMYAGRARALIMLLAVLLPPFVVIFVAVTVGTIVILLFIPLIELLNKLS